MAKLALGLIETVGLAAAFEAADTAVKSADVELLGYELSKGNGMATVKVVGSVSAVKAAVSAGSAAAEKVNTVWSTDIIPRPHDEIEDLIRNEKTVGLKKETPIGAGKVTKASKDVAKESEESKIDKQSEISQEVAVDSEKDDQQEADNQDNKADKVETDELENEDKADEEKRDETEKDEVEKDETEKDKVETKKEEDICNMCGDPACSRVKGELRVNCIHYEEE